MKTIESTSAGGAFPAARLSKPPASTIRWSGGEKPVANPRGREARRHSKQGISTMGQAIVDPQELRRFAARLRHFSEEVMSQMQNVQRQLAALGSTWRDQEHKKFEEEFAQQLNTFGRFVQSTGEYVPYLIRKAERVEEYQQQR
jgi:uncharacterized protein YukE